MKNLFKSVVLSIALMLPFAVSAQDVAKTTGSVVNENEGAPVEWAISAEELEDGNFAVTLEATIAEGYHGYPMTDFSAPYFEFDNAEVVGDIVETLTPEEHGIDELTGEPSLIYYNKAIYVHTIKSEAGKKVTGYISATICTNDTNQCTSNPATFSIQMPGEAVVAAAEETEGATSAAAPLDWGSIITAILWGFAALLTPCVFPMVPMTVSFFVKGSQSPAQGRFRATMYGVFIVALYVLPIAILVLLSNAFGTNVAGDIFNAIGTHWIPNLIFFVIFMIFAASFLGAFEITLPSSLVNKSDEGADKGGLVGIFFMALTLVLVSFSCTGPIVGSVIISSTSGGVWMPIITMAAFAIAFALPFTVLAWFPSLLKNMPKSGGWLNSVKVVLGFIEVALGLKFLMTADQTMHWGLLDREVYLAIWIVTFSLLGLYLLGKLRFAHDDEVKHVSVFRLTLAIAVFSFVVYMIPGMFGAPLNAISGYIPPMTTQDYQINGRVENANTGRKYADFLHLPHQLEGHFDFEEAVADAKKQNKPIFVDVTGHACNNCREMETMVWSHSSILPMLQNDFVICALYVDDNTKVEDGKRLGSINSKFAQDRWGVNAQPGYILLSPDGETVLAGPRGYDTNIDGFIKFLETAKNAM
ncbi:MAG: thioredoxin family protein [Alistipes sp.]|nr:thioredoxin family protein [Alistipes sp.]